MMDETLYNARIADLATNLIAHKYVQFTINKQSNKVVLYIKNNENYNELNDDDKYNVMLYLQRYYINLYTH
jgi:hypothetical protein